MRPLLRRLLWVLGVSGTFVLLALLGVSLASLLTPGAPARPDSEPARPAPPPPPSPSAPPAPARLPEPPTPPEPPRAPQAPAAAERERERVDAGALPVPEMLRLRRDLIRSIAALKQEISRCPSQPARQVPGSRAALVLDLQGVTDGARVLGTTLEADVPVNDQFVACVSTALQGKTLTASGANPGLRLRFFIPLGLGGNTLGLSSASLTQGDDAAAPR